MFRAMRCKNQELTKEETLDIIMRNGTGTLAINGLDGYPYSVPVNYAYIDGKIYFHGASSGHKYDAIKACSRASISIIDTEVLVKEKFTTDYRSAICFGDIRIMDKTDNTKEILRQFALKFCPEMVEEGKKEVEKSWVPVSIFEMELVHITGKKAMY